MKTISILRAAFLVVVAAVLSACSGSAPAPDDLANPIKDKVQPVLAMLHAKKVTAVQVVSMSCTEQGKNFSCKGKVKLTEQPLRGEAPITEEVIDFNHTFARGDAGWIIVDAG